MHTFRAVVMPVLSAYVLVAGIVLYAAKHPTYGGVGHRWFVWRSRLALIGVTICGGYLVFLAIVVVFHVWLVGQRGVIRSALCFGAFLSIVAAVVFVGLSAIERRRAR